MLQGKVCQRFDLEGTDLVRRSTRTSLELRSKNIDSSQLRLLVILVVRSDNGKR